MNSILLLVLSLSLSASLLAAALLAFRPLYRDRLSKTWQYYIWLVVVIRLLVPLAPETNLMGALFKGLPPAASSNAPSSRQQPVSVMDPFSNTVLEEPDTKETISVGMVSPSPVTAAGVMPDIQPQGQLWEHLWMLWFIPALVLLVRSVTSYNSFVRYILAGREEIRDEDVLTACQRACEETGVRRPLPVYRNKLASSPMLVGLLRPCIILPDLDLEVEKMQLVLRHELIHYKRLDLLYKWLVQLTLCLHWFNPLLYLVSKEIGRCCELSCDAQVVAALPVAEKTRYGDTLLASIKAGGTYNNTVASVTLSEDGRELKERLHSILKFQPSSRQKKWIALACSVVLLYCATFSGAYMGFSAAANDTPTRVTAVTSRSAVVPDDSLGNHLSRAIRNNVETYVQDNVENWATQWAEDWAYDWSDYWIQWAEQWEDQWDEAYDGQRNNESWRYLNYIYQDGYLVGLGVLNRAKEEHYSRVDTITAAGVSYTVAFAEGYESYGEDEKALSIIKQLLAERPWGHSTPSLFVVRSVSYNADPAGLLRQLYDSRAFVEFMELVTHCKGLPVIEELLYAAAEDKESMYFMFLAEQLPADFAGGEALARKAAEQRDFIMLSNMEPFLSPALYEALVQEALDLSILPE